MVGTRRVTTYGRVYEVLCGPHVGNNGSLYVVRDVDDGIIEFKSEGLLQGLEEVED
jgi:hypothetical protein